MSRRRGLLVLALVLAAIGTGSGPAAAPACAAGGTYVVVRDSRGTVEHRCVNLEAESPPHARINSVDLLRAVGYDVATRDYGGALGEAVCSLNGDGTPASDCPAASGHWHLWLYSDGRWAESIEGASTTEVERGDILGWTWQTRGANEPPPEPDLTIGCTNRARNITPLTRPSSRGPAGGLVVAGVAAGAVGWAIRQRRQRQ